jgi:hypothetical protein
MLRQIKQLAEQLTETVNKELLEVCDELLGLKDAAINCIEEYGGNPDWVTCLVEKAGAVIAKAKGK